MLRNLISPAFHALHRAVEWAGEITPGTRASRGFAHFGEKSLIAFPQATILGERGILIGSEVLIGRHCTLALGYGPGDHPLPERGLAFGDRCVVGANSTFTAHESIEIGDDVWFGQSVFVSDASHGYQDPDAPIGRQLGRHQPVRIGSGSWIGHGVVVLPGTTIGRNVVVGAGSVVRGDVLDHSIVAGVPARVVRRLEPGVGWVGKRPDDVRPIWSAEEIARFLS
ncbi:acyltransferase [Nocardioides jensenii]|uniref:acyltransferase n=1 Tax=Nocardioides jensenii TaxID=1843 RepID=UPI0008354055|nr:acyltransferase [Nocardioides jensenii]